MIVHKPSGFSNYVAFEKILVHALHRHPLATTVLMYHFYNKIKGKSIYCLLPSETSSGYHVMVLASHGVDKRGQPFFEFQDSYRKKWKNRGFIRIAKEKGLIVEFVFILPWKGKFYFVFGFVFHNLV